MPTIVVETPLAEAARERSFAKAVSMWLRHQGIDINHVITKFVHVDAQRVFSGPFPLAGARTGAETFAFVRCTVGHERSAGFRRELAREVVAALSPAVPAERVFVQFLPTDPELHFIGSDLERQTRNDH